MELVRGSVCVVIGLGISGMAAVRFLNDLGMHVSVSENRPENAIDKTFLAELQRMGVPIETGGHREDFFKDAQLIVPSPGVPLGIPVIRGARNRSVTIAGELAIAAGRTGSPIIGVTGSNGKTTVTSLIGHLLKADNRKVFVGGNIGTPLVDYLRGEQEAEALVLELSSFQLEIGGEFRPDIALLLNLSPDHIDRHGSLEKYADAKRRIFSNQRTGDVAIVGSDDPLVMQNEITTAGRVFRFGTDPSSEAVVQQTGVLLRGEPLGLEKDEFYEVGNTVLSSFVNRLNAAAAILAVRAHGSSAAAIRKGLADYISPPHRMALVAEIAGVRYVDDSKGTNVGAVAAALSSCGGKVILIAGGRNKGSDFTVLAAPVIKYVRHLILIGEAAEEMEDILGEFTQVSRAADMDAAVALAAGIAERGDTVLLSPGCASFDMFTSYAHRGEVFQKAVLQLQKVSHNCC